MQLAFGGNVGTITVNGKVYNFDKMHWHSPSDHTINGQRFPLELHLVHKSADGAVAVIGILYQLGAPDSFYYQVARNLGCTHTHMNCAPPWMTNTNIDQ
jgi:carbonic anhydrase